MTIVSSRAFSANPIHYLNLADKESVAVRRGKKIYRITPESAKYKNTIDPEDPYWDDQRNYDEFMRRINMTEKENPVVAVLKSKEDIHNYMKKFLT